MFWISAKCRHKSRICSLLTFLFRLHLTGLTPGLKPSQLPSTVPWLPLASGLAVFVWWKRNFSFHYLLPLPLSVVFFYLFSSLSAALIKRFEMVCARRRAEIRSDKLSNRRSSSNSIDSNENGNNNSKLYRPLEKDKIMCFDFLFC